MMYIILTRGVNFLINNVFNHSCTCDWIIVKSSVILVPDINISVFVIPYPIVKTPDILKFYIYLEKY